MDVQPILSKFFKKKVPFLRIHSATIAVVLIYILYCILFSFLSIQKYQAFNCDLDLGNMLQAFYNNLHERFMELTWNGGELNGCTWAGHTEIIFLFLLPFFMLAPSAETLLILQTLAIGAGGLAVYFTAQHLLRKQILPVLLAVCYWIYPLLASINLVDFHSDAFIIAPHLFAWYFLRTGRNGMFWGSIILGILIKEHAFLFNGLLGILLYPTDRRRAVILLLLGISQFFILTPLIQYFAGADHYQLTLEKHVFGNIEQTPVQTIWTYIDHFRHNLFSSQSFFVLLIIITLNITLFLFPRGLIMIIPLAMIFIATGSVTSHRHAILIAPLFITLVEGVARIKTDRQFRYVIGGVFIPTILSLLLSPDSLLGTNIRELLRPEFRNLFHYRYTPHDAIADSLVRLIPPEVPVAADAPLRTKLVDRQYAFIHPSPRDSMRADYYLFDFFEKREYDDAWPARKRVAALLHSGNFSLMSNVDGLVILENRRAVDGTIDFRLRQIDTIAISSSSEYVVNTIEIDTADAWYTMRMRFGKGVTDTTLKQSFISLFIDKSANDTIRVLHLASYTLCRLEQLNAGWYDEKFRFNLPAGKSIGNRRHEIWVYAKLGYLPFFARSEYRYRLCRKNDFVRFR